MQNPLILRIPVKPGTILIAILAGLSSTAPGAAWTLEQDNQVWTIDEQHGCIQSMTQGELKMLSKGYDLYSLPTVTNGYQGSERDDEVTGVRDGDLPGKLVLECVNRKLKLNLTKTYFFEPEMGWFCKRVEVNAPRQEKGFLVLAAGVKFAGGMWNDAIIHHPGSHGHSQTGLRTSRVEEPVGLRNADGSGMVCLSNYANDRTLTTVRIAGRDKPTYWMFNPQFSGFPVPNGKGKLVDYAVPGLDRMWSVTTPGRWEMPFLYGAVGNGVEDTIIATVAYPVTKGNYADFCALYAGRKAIREMLNYEAFDRPRWVKDIVMGDWEDYQVTPNKGNKQAGKSWKRILDKMWFGYAVVVNYGYFVSSWGYPANDEEWATHYITISAREQPVEEFRAWLEGMGKNPEEYIVDEDEHFFVTRNPFKPAEFVESRLEILEAAGNPPRLKIGDYTHTGHGGFDRTARFLKDYPDAIVYRRNGKVYSNAADYSHDWFNPVGVGVTILDPAFADYWVNRCAERIRNLGIDFYYVDSFCRNAYFADWKGHRVSRDEDAHPLWQRLIETCREADVPMFHNNPFAVYNDIGYTEHGWFSTWQADWRMWASRQMAHNAMNPKGRPLIQIGDRDPKPYDHLREAPSASMRLFAPLLWNIRMSFNNFGHMFPDRQATFTIESLPWIQAAYELRMRTYANPDVRPRWWAYETALEAQPYQLGESGVIAFMNHDDTVEDHAISYQPGNFDELKSDRPTWVWRIDIPDPHNISYEGVTDTSPIRRLAKQTRAGFFERLPERIEYQGDFPKKLPALFVVTQVPGLIEQVDGKGCQLLLPENYRARVTGTCDLEHQKISLMIKSDHDSATVLVPMFEGKDTYHVLARSMTRMHNAGVLPGLAPVEHETADINGLNFVRLFVEKGETEFIIE